MSLARSMNGMMMLIPTQALNNLGFRLWDNHQCHLGEKYHQYYDGNQYISHNVHNTLLFIGYSFIAYWLLLQRLNGNDGTLTTDDTNCGVHRDVGVRFADRFPQVTINFDIAVGSGLHHFRDFSRAS